MSDSSEPGPEFGLHRIGVAGGALDVQRDDGPLMSPARGPAADQRRESQRFQL